MQDFNQVQNDHKINLKLAATAFGETVGYTVPSVIFLYVYILHDSVLQCIIFYRMYVMKPKEQVFRLLVSIAGWLGCDATMDEPAVYVWNVLSVVYGGFDSTQYLLGRLSLQWWMFQGADLYKVLVSKH